MILFTACLNAQFRCTSVLYRWRKHEGGKNRLWSMGSCLSCYTVEISKFMRTGGQITRPHPIYPAWHSPQFCSGVTSKSHESWFNHAEWNHITKKGMYPIWIASGTGSVQIVHVVMQKDQIWTTCSLSLLVTGFTEGVEKNIIIIRLEAAQISHFCPIISLVHQTKFYDVQSSKYKIRQSM